MVPTSTSREYYSSNAGDSQWSFSFFAIRKEDVYVSVAGVQVACTVLLNDNRVGGSVRISSPVTVGQKIVVYRQTPLVQDLHLAYNSDLPSESVEEVLDRMTCVAQEARDLATEAKLQIEAALLLAKGDDGKDGLDAGGSGVANVYSIIFKNSAVRPEAPAAHNDEPIPDGWLDDPDDTADAVWWRSEAVFTGDSAHVVVRPWTTPVRISGQQAVSSVTVWKKSDTIPLKPTFMAYPPPENSGGWVLNPTPEADGTYARWWFCDGRAVGSAVQTWLEPVVGVGEKGSDGVSGEYVDYIYKAVPDGETPARPTGTVKPADWFEVPPEVQEGFVLWSSLIWRNAKDDTPVNGSFGVWQIPTRMTGWTGAAGSDGNDGANADYPCRMFKASVERPETPAVGRTVSEMLAAGWQDYMGDVTVGIGNSPRKWWVTETIISGEDDETPIYTNNSETEQMAWSVPSPAVSFGQDNIYIVYKATSGVPTKPVSSVHPDADNFETATGWSYSPPVDASPDDDIFVWMSKCVFDTANDYWVQGWTTPVRVSGENGDDGLDSTVTIFLYKWWLRDGTAPPAVTLPPNGEFGDTVEDDDVLNSEYKFAGDILNWFAMADGGGWYENIPANTTAQMSGTTGDTENANNVLWMMMLRVSGDGKRVVNIGSPVRLTGMDGQDGMSGYDGKDGSNGINGTHGAPGSNGANGTHGLSGDKGEKGDKGEDGVDGINGEGTYLLFCVSEFKPDPPADFSVISSISASLTNANTNTWSYSYDFNTETADSIYGLWCISVRKTSTGQLTRTGNPFNLRGIQGEKGERGDAGVTTLFLKSYSGSAQGYPAKTAIFEFRVSGGVCCLRAQMTATALDENLVFELPNDLIPIAYRPTSGNFYDGTHALSSLKKKLLCFAQCGSLGHYSGDDAHAGAMVGTLLPTATTLAIPYSVTTISAEQATAPLTFACLLTTDNARVFSLLWLAPLPLEIGSPRVLGKVFPWISSTTFTLTIAATSDVESFEWYQGTMDDVSLANPQDLTSLATVVGEGTLVGTTTEPSLTLPKSGNGGKYYWVKASNSYGVVMTNATYIYPFPD